MKSLLLVAFTLTGSLVVGAADPLSVAKDLYASAAYEDALTALTEARKATPATSQDALQLDEYRVFCLFALGRRAEADTLAQSIVRTDPFIKLGDDASPAITTLFAGARKQTFPAMIKEKYRDAKAAMDRKDFAAAEPQLLDVQKLIAEWGKLGGADDSINDIGVLADGFLALGRRERADAHPAAPAAQPADTPTAASTRPLNLPYRADSPGVEPPVTLVQALPPVPEALAKFGEKRGVIEVTIEQDGRVGNVLVRESLNPTYDRMAVDAAKRWLYKPATKDGQPVRFVKLVAITLKGGSEE